MIDLLLNYIDKMLYIFACIVGIFLGIKSEQWKTNKIKKENKKLENELKEQKIKQEQKELQSIADNHKKEIKEIDNDTKITNIAPNSDIII